MSEAHGTKATTATNAHEGMGLSDNHQEWCDRRLSRAARKLVHHHLLQVIQAESGTLFHVFFDQSDVWVLLEYWLHANGRRMDLCPLNPTLDAYRIDEEHSLVVDAPHHATAAYPTFAAQQRRKGKRKRTLFECGYSKRTFISRYYLDKHLDKNHKLDELSTFCPASDWCKVVGLANCHATALEEEPYYGQGSDGWGDDGNLLRHKWVKKAHSIPCIDAKIREDCHSVMDLCGITDSSQRWCDSLACPTHRLGDILSSDLRGSELESMSHAIALLMAVVVLFVYCCFYLQPLDLEDEHVGPTNTFTGRLSTTSSKKHM